MLIRKEEEKDYFIVENLTREAFWNVYHPGATEHLVLHNARSKDDFIKDLDPNRKQSLSGSSYRLNAAHVYFA